MIFEFAVHPSFNFVTSFAQKLNVRAAKDRLTIPASLGRGYVRKIDIEPEFKFVLHHYTLKEDFLLRRLAPTEKSDLISIIFNSQEIPSRNSADQQLAIQFLKTNGSAIQIASSSLGTETFFPAGHEVNFGVIGIRSSLLASLLHMEKPEGLLSTILGSKTDFFFHESMTPDAQRILKQLSAANSSNELDHLYYRIRVQELLYGLFNTLLHRDAERHSPINHTDLNSLYTVRTTMLADLSLPPRLNELAQKTGLSETKMKQLFKQVFGDTVYNYYQRARMEEAAFLLKKAGYSVSETGYHLGFSNLSHFSRLFERHYGMTPKKFTVTG